MLHEELTEKIIGAFYKVYNTLGYGFLEKVYENSMAIECRKAGLTVEQQKNIRVYYDNEEVGLLFNFGKEAQLKRKIFHNKIKHHKH